MATYFGHVAALFEESLYGRLFRWYCTGNGQGKGPIMAMLAIIIDRRNELGDVVHFI